MSIRLFATLTILLSTLAAPSAQADNIDVVMNGVFPQQQPAYIGFDSVERIDIPATSRVDRKYLIVDFRFQSTPPQQQLLASVHEICMALLRDRNLIQSLSDSGYDMVAVAFDKSSQYDCL
ncbi:MAG: hypothetical protein WD623_02980 [Marinobacter sp.]|uniref:hypothetical protein n=1 Tax=Marinobacter sp. TaxID=50741 RepID=UPI0034A09764